jgi:hypothetical protein
MTDKQATIFTVGMMVFLSLCALGMMFEKSNSWKYEAVSRGYGTIDNGKFQWKENPCK